LPYYYINLKTGVTKGEIINVAEAGSYLLEFGILSYYTENPKYYQIAKRAVKKIHSSRSTLGLTGRDIENVTTKKQKDEMETFFIAETMKYFYLVFSSNPSVNPDDYVFSTEAHPFKKGNFKAEKINRRLGIN